ncbi:MAG: hypothetical protein ACR2I5_07900 [Candidatus Limnocylindria bacterium]
MPGDAVFSECDKGQFGTLAFAVGLGRDPTPSRYHQAPGQIDEFWIVDRNGVLAIFDLTYYEGTPQTDIDDMRAIVESATFRRVGGPHGLPTVSPTPRSAEGAEATPSRCRSMGQQCAHLPAVARGCLFYASLARTGSGSCAVVIELSPPA